MSTLIELNKALNVVDDGPCICSLESVCKKDPLPYGKMHDTTVSELLALRESFDIRAKQDSESAKESVSLSVAAWIFHSNKLEFSAQDNEGDTEKLVKGCNGPIRTAAQENSLKTLHLLRETYETPYRASKPEAAVSFDSEKLKAWHLKLFPIDSYHFGGQFRTSAAFTRNLSGTTMHYYPHNGIIKSAIGQLGAIVYQQLKLLRQVQDPMRRLAQTFAIAAFCHFHFLDIHPFADGNGRIGRYLAKRLLDLELPVPFPLFQNREEYVAVLEMRSQGAADVVVSKLMEIMLKNAIRHYQRLLHKNRTYDIFVCGVEVDEIKVTLKTVLPYANRNQVDAVLLKFQEMEEGENIDVELEETIIRMKKFPSFIVDDI